MRLSPRFYFTASILFCTGTLLAQTSKFTDAFLKQTNRPWGNPVMEVKDDPRKMVDIKPHLEKHPFSVYAPQYFPGWVLHSNSEHLSLFQDLPSDWRVGGPTRLAVPLPGKCRVFTEGEKINPRYASGMHRSWILVWFSGAKNWDQFDMPVLIVLDKPPSSIKLENGLHLEFRGKAGYVVVMNLYGYYKPPQDNPQSRAFAERSRRYGGFRETMFGEKMGKFSPVNIFPYQWEMLLPKHVTERCDYFAQVCKAIPYRVKDDFQVDLAGNALHLRYKVKYLEIKDHWDTKAIKLAPVSPTLALAAKSGLPVHFSENLVDPMYPTPLGPWCGIQDVDSYQVELLLLKYLTETYQLDLAKDAKDPIAKEAAKTLADNAAPFCLSTGPFPPSKDMEKYLPTDLKGPNFLREIVTCDRTKALAMRNIPDDKLVAAQRNLGNIFRFSYFTTRGYKWGKIGRSSFLYWPDLQVKGDLYGLPGQRMMDEFMGGWYYVYNSRDMSWLGNSAGAMKRLVNAIPQLGWAQGSGRNVTCLGSQAGPPLAFSRLMYGARDQAAFAWGTYTTVMEMLNLHAKCGAMASYARHFQPWHDSHTISPAANAYKCLPGAKGWSFAQPGVSTPNGVSGTTLWKERWKHMSDFDIDRFLRDFCVKNEGGLTSEFAAWRDVAFKKLKADTAVPQNQQLDPFINPAKLMSLEKYYVGASDYDLKKNFGGYQLTFDRVFRAAWNWEPTPWLYWGLKPERRYERIMKDETLPWTPGLGSIYPSQEAELLYRTAPLNDENGARQAIPVIQVGRVTAFSGKADASWSLGYITPFPGKKVEKVLRQGRLISYSFSTEDMDEDPFEIALEGTWNFALDPKAAGLAAGWYKPGVYKGKWERITVPGDWENQGFCDEGRVKIPVGKIPKEIGVTKQPDYQWEYDGTAWYQNTFPMPADKKGHDFIFEAGDIDDFDYVWINGTKIGSTTAGSKGKDKFRRYPIPADALRFGGRNTITIMACDQGGLGGIRRGPVRIIEKKK